eukprot:4647877-Pyramimonas_sp.AAC.3
MLYTTNRSPAATEGVPESLDPELVLHSFGNYNVSRVARWKHAYKFKSDEQTQPSSSTPGCKGSPHIVRAGVWTLLDQVVSKQ